MIPPNMNLTDEQLYEFCQANKDVRIERTSRGELLIMLPTGGMTGKRNFKLTTTFGNWVEKDKTGIGFDSSTGFMLPNKALRSPDVAWVSLSRWEALSEKQKEKFIPLCPDFIIELRSPSDDIEKLKEKMQEYIDNGSTLGWLIDPKEKKVYIYRPQKEVECLENPNSISAEPILSGFTINLTDIFA
jgi:Uma2 family endonuclease